MALVPWTELSADTKPLRIRVREDASAGGGQHHQHRRDHCGDFILQQRHLQHRRMLYSLAQRGQGPRALGRLNTQHVPATGIHVSTAVMLIGVVLNYLVPEKVFRLGHEHIDHRNVWTWGVIMVAHRNYRRAGGRGPLESSTYPHAGSAVRKLASRRVPPRRDGDAWRDPEHACVYVAPCVCVVGTGLSAVEARPLQSGLKGL